MRFTQVNLLAGEEVSYVAYDNSRDDSSGPRYRELLREAFEESKGGVAIVFSPIVVVGQKIIM